eukprot:6209649-Pleurochrysis_carterae.AAC.2
MCEHHRTAQGARMKAAPRTCAPSATERRKRCTARTGDLTSQWLHRTVVYTLLSQKPQCLCRRPPTRAKTPKDVQQPHRPRPRAARTSKAYVRSMRGNVTCREGLRRLAEEKRDPRRLREPHRTEVVGLEQPLVGDVVCEIRHVQAARGVGGGAIRGKTHVRLRPRQQPANGTEKTAPPRHVYRVEQDAQVVLSRDHVVIDDKNVLCGHTQGNLKPSIVLEIVLGLKHRDARVVIRPNRGFY